MVVNFHNSRPTASNNEVTMLPNELLVFSLADFGYQDEEGNTFASIKITALETAGLLSLNDNNIVLDQIISIQNIKAGLLKYQAPLVNTEITESFQFSVNDGALDSTSNYTYTFKIIFDADNDGIVDSTDNCPTKSNPDQTDTDNDSMGNACDTDDDNDGLPDTWEVENGTNPLIADANEDIDNDGNTNLEEYRAETNPKPDTDRDGMPDQWEIDNGFDPKDDSDCPSWACGPNPNGWRSILYQSEP